VQPDADALPASFQEAYSGANGQCAQHIMDVYASDLQLLGYVQAARSGRAASGRRAGGGSAAQVEPAAAGAGWGQQRQGEKRAQVAAQRVQGSSSAQTAQRGSWAQEAQTAQRGSWAQEAQTAQRGSWAQEAQGPKRVQGLQQAQGAQRSAWPRSSAASTTADMLR
jgi:hypothetical protein